MDQELKSIFVPELRKRGFTGSYPHFRRKSQDASYDVLSIQFSMAKPAFTIEVGSIDAEYIKDHYLNENRINSFHAEKWARIGSYFGEDPWLFFAHDPSLELIQKKYKIPKGLTPQPLDLRTRLDQFDQLNSSNIKLIKRHGNTIFEFRAKEACTFLDEAEARWKEKSFDHCLESIFPCPYLESNDRSILSPFRNIRRTVDYHFKKLLHR